MLAENPDLLEFWKKTAKEKSTRMNSLTYEKAVVKDSLAYIRGYGEHEGEAWHHISILGKTKAGWEFIPGGEMTTVAAPKVPF